MENKLYISKSSIHGKGLFSSINLASDTKIILVADDNKRIFGGKWITYLGDYLNHQKNGNVSVKKIGKQYFIFASKNINANEELTTDYRLVPHVFNRNINGYTEN